MKAVSIALGTGSLLVAGYAVFGQLGLFAVVAPAAVAGLLAARFRIPAAPPPRSSPPRQGRHTNAPFAAYRRIESALAQAQMSRRLYDHTARPLLQRLLAALLADRRGVDMATDTPAAREAVGAELWPLLDPARPASGDSWTPGPGTQALARIADRLEEL